MPFFARSAIWPFSLRVASGKQMAAICARVRLRLATGFQVVFYSLAKNSCFLPWISAYGDKFYRHKRFLMRKNTIP